MADDNNIIKGGTDDSNELLLPNAESIESATPVVAGTTIIPAPASEPVAQPAPPAPQKMPAAIPEDETELERINRLKLNADDAPHSGVINDDIAKILKEVKLPERRSFKGAAEPPTVAAPIAPETPETKDKSAPDEQKGPKEREIVTAVHTLKDDVQDVVRDRQISMVRASALEQDKKSRKAPEIKVRDPGVVQRRRRTFALIFFALLLVGLGSAALFGVALVIKDRAETPSVQYPSLIFAENTVTLPIDNATPESLKATIAQARTTTEAPLGSITRIVPTVSVTNAGGVSTTEPATLQQFFTALGLQTPVQLMQGLGTTFFFGLHTVSASEPVFVIPVTSYDLAFAGMLAWEPTMDQDLAPAFDAVPALITGPGGLPTARTFTDAVMLNYDVRELRDDSGNVVLYYSFPTPNILVIAENPSTFAEVLSRLEAQREL